MINGADPVLVTLVVVALGVAASCADEGPRFGDPYAIDGRSVRGSGPSRGETGDGGAGADGPFGAAYDPADDPKPPGQTAKAAHAAASSAGAPPPTDGQTDCLSCHRAGGTATPWSAAGLVVSKSPGTGAPNADVVIVNADGTRVGPAKTDADGFFWITTQSGAVATNAKVYVRNAEGSAEMAGAIGPADGSCNRAGCHGSSQASVYVPK